jgi:hypothetical protein
VSTNTTPAPSRLFLKIARVLFDIDRLLQRPNAAEAKWSMYTDTSIILRGSNYYFCLTRNPESSVADYFNLVTPFIHEAKTVIEHLAKDDPDLTSFKLALAITDNVRNILLQTLYLAFLADSRLSNSFITTREIYSAAVLPHTDFYFNLLLNPDIDWVTSLAKYRSLLTELRAI